MDIDFRGEERDYAGLCKVNQAWGPSAVTRQIISLPLKSMPTTSSPFSLILFHYFSFFHSFLSLSQTHTHSFKYLKSEKSQRSHWMCSPVEEDESASLNKDNCLAYKGANKETNWLILPLLPCVSRTADET